jgi:hypothetical protein
MPQSQRRDLKISTPLVKPVVFLNFNLEEASTPLLQMQITVPDVRKRANQPQNVPIILGQR